MSWSNNHSEDVATWGALYILEESRKTFDQSGGVLMKDLKFFVPGSGTNVLRMRATALAVQMHNMFTVAFGAERETGVSVKKAVGDMVTVLMTATKTMEELADINDSNYVFKPVVLHT